MGLLQEIELTNEMFEQQQTQFKVLSEKEIEQTLEGLQYDCINQYESIIKNEKSKGYRPKKKVTMKNYNCSDSEPDDISDG